MTHLWVRAESRPHEDRVGITAEGVRDLIARGFTVTVEDSTRRILPIAPYRLAGAQIAPPGSWREAPKEALIFGLKELPDDGSPLPHRHIMFGHAYKDQAGARPLLSRFRAGGGALYDLEYLTDEGGRRLAAFGYWAGYAGAAVTLKCWIAQQRGGICAPVHAYPNKGALTDELRAELTAIDAPAPSAIVIGAKGRVGRGAADLCAELGLPVTGWDMSETAHGGPFPEILDHTLFLNCILAQDGCPVFVPAEAAKAPRALRAIGDIACDPSSPFNPIKVYDAVTDWDAPARRVADAPPLDVMAIDNLPSMLPLESSQDFAAQLLPVLAQLDQIETGPWGRAGALFARHVAAL